MGESTGYPSHGELRVGQEEKRGQSSPAAEQHPLAGGRLCYRARGRASPPSMDTAS